jgi:hypothetical protein
MTIPSWNKPPPLSTPQNAPWTDIEQMRLGLQQTLAALNQTNVNLQALIALLGGQGGGVPPITPDWHSLPDVIAANAPATTDFTGLVNLQSTVLARLCTLYEDYGVSTGGSNTVLNDPKKYWLNDWTGHTLFVYVQGILYVTTIISNTTTQLTFEAITQGVTIDNKTVYWIQPIGTEKWVSQTPVVIYNALPSGIGTFNSTSWFDMTNIKRALIYVVSSLNQAVSVQVVGNITPSFNTAVNIMPAISLAIGSVTPAAGDRGVGTNDDWHPFLAVQITTTVAPASGLVTVTVCSQG